jgi:SAM-dependent methyltransferase
MKRTFTAAYLLAKRALSLESRQDRFRRYALLNKWKNKESVSGPGSTLAYTARLRKALPLLFDEYSITTVLDAPCGDYNWMRLVERPGVQYIGGEIVPELVDANNARYRDESTRFIHCDIVQDELPVADVWICRDTLFHFSYADVFRTLDNLFRSEIKYFLATHCPIQQVNSDIRTGSCFSRNLLGPPFCFPEPSLWLEDGIEDGPPRRMGLWEVKALQAAMTRNAAYQQRAA